MDDFWTTDQEQNVLRLNRVVPNDKDANENFLYLEKRQQGFRQHSKTPTKKSPTEKLANKENANRKKNNTEIANRKKGQQTIRRQKKGQRVAKNVQIAES